MMKIRNTTQQARKGKPGITIRQRLMLSFVLVALLPALAISVGSLILGYTNGRQQVLDRLNSVASLKEVEITSWLDARNNELIFLSNSNYNLERIQTVLKLSSQDKYYDFYFKALQNTFLRLSSDSETVRDFSLLDSAGNVVLSTDEQLIGVSFAEEPFIQLGMSNKTVQFWYGEQHSEEIFVINAIPVPGKNGENIGILISRCLPANLSAILSEQTGMGNSGKAYLVTAENQIADAHVLSGVMLPVSSQNENILLLSKNSSLPAVYRDHEGVRVIGVQRWLSEFQASLVVAQDMNEAFRTILDSLGVNLVIALITLLGAIAVSIAISRSISTPLTHLSCTAVKIAAGDLNQSVQVQKHDEIGALAESFNSMTRQLRELINDLEHRVQERTRSLEQRALQLETSSQVSREITSILEIETLIERIVDRICSSFGYYNVNIFLLETATGCLRIWASSQPEKMSSLTLSIDSSSLNGKAVHENKAVIVNDVMAMPEFLPLEQLPETRSELVIPLRIGREVIGTLDVQSREPGSFSPEDVLLIQSLGDQIAIAIENARLYKQSQRLAVVEERNRLARDMHDSVIQSLYSLGLLIEGWREMSKDSDSAMLLEVLNRTAEINQQVLREMRLLIHELRPPILEKEGLVNALQKRLDAVETRAGVHARLLVEGYSRLPATIEEDLYRITIEALNNALKHSNASSVVVRIFAQDGVAYIRIHDDGCGFDIETAQSSGGMGLASMQERATKLAAAFQIISAPGNGTKVEVCIPGRQEDQEMVSEGKS